MSSPTIPRRIYQRLLAHLELFPAVALLGPRQVGKTTLAWFVAEQGVREGPASGGPSSDAPARREPGLYLDLENPAHLERLSDAAGYLSSVRDRLVVLDEIHRAPELFQTLRGVIDERIFAGEPAGQFLILGSASVELLRQSGESLAGRIGHLELTPLDVREVGPAEATRLWVRGGFPLSFLAPDARASALWRESFVRTYLERDVPELGPRVPAVVLRRFWTMLAHSQGGVWNGAKLARSLGVDGKTVARYLDLMVDLLLVRRLPPLHANVRKRLVKSPKVYVRDSGIVHALLRISDHDELLGHPVAGASWEGFVVENLLAAASEWTQASFYRTATGAEIDLVLDLPGNRRWAVETKRSTAPRLPKGFRVALQDVPVDRAFLVYGGDERYPKGGGVEAIGLRELMEEVAALD